MFPLGTAGADPRGDEADSNVKEKDEEAKIDGRKLGPADGG